MTIATTKKLASAGNNTFYTTWSTYWLLTVKNKNTSQSDVEMLSSLTLYFLPSIIASITGVNCIGVAYLSTSCIPHLAWGTLTDTSLEIYMFLGWGIYDFTSNSYELVIDGNNAHLVFSGSISCYISFPLLWFISTTDDGSWSATAQGTTTGST